MSIVMFRESRMLKGVSLVAATLIYVTALLPSAVLAQSSVSVASGTTVTLRTKSLITPSSLNVGDTVPLEVASDVVVDGKVVIRAGAEASGEVVRSKSNNYIGIPAEIGITPRWAKAVDGTNVSLTGGSKMVEGKDKMVVSIGLSLVCCILFALMKGGAAEIQPGTEFMANVASSASVKVR